MPNSLKTFDISGARPRSRPGLSMGNLVAPNGMYTLQRWDLALCMLLQSYLDICSFSEGPYATVTENAQEVSHLLIKYSYNITGCCVCYATHARITRPDEPRKTDSLLLSPIPLVFVPILSSHRCSHPLTPNHLWAPHHSEDQWEPRTWRSGRQVRPSHIATQ
jgi:hypothetical protein